MQLHLVSLILHGHVVSLRLIWGWRRHLKLEVLALWLNEIHASGFNSRLDVVALVWFVVHWVLRQVVNCGAHLFHEQVKLAVLVSILGLLPLVKGVGARAWHAERHSTVAAQIATVHVRQVFVWTRAILRTLLVKRISHRRDSCWILCALVDTVDESGVWSRSIVLCWGRMAHRLVKQSRCLLSEHQIFLWCLIDSLATPVTRVDCDALLARDLILIMSIFQIWSLADHVHTRSTPIDINSGHCRISICDFFYWLVALIVRLCASLLRIFSTERKSICVSELSSGISSSDGQLFVFASLDSGIHSSMRIWSIQFQFGWGANFRVKTISLVLWLHKRAIMVVRNLWVFWIWNSLTMSLTITLREDWSILWIDVLVLVESHVGVVDNCSLTVYVLHFSSLPAV